MNEQNANNERLEKLILLARMHLKHPTKKRKQIIFRREKMKELIRLKVRLNGCV